MAKTKVAIIGGGTAGVTAAFELTATPALRERFDVTLHTLGWRLGGKGASGRNRDFACRIEEHGLHVWFGFYDKSFEVLKRAYDEMQKPANPLFNSVADAFRKAQNIRLWNECPPGSGKWQPIEAKIPPIPGGSQAPWQMLQGALDLIDGPGPDRDVGQATQLITEHEKLAREAGLLDPEPLVFDAFDVALEMREAEGALANTEGLVALEKPVGQTWELLPLARELARARATTEGLAAPKLAHEKLVARALRGLRAPWNSFSRRLVADFCTARLVYMGIDFVGALWWMIVFDVLAAGTFDNLDDQELTARLRQRGMSSYTARNAPWLRGFYDLVFAFEQGDWTKRNLAAGSAIKAMLQIAFNSQGSVMWKMNAGMGDVVFSPLYQVLCQRGVKVRFFQRVMRLELSGNRTRVERVVIEPQAQLKPNLPPHWPFVQQIQDWPCWPSEPEWDCIENAGQLQQALAGASTTLEDETWSSGLAKRTLQRGADFDHVVLAASIESVRDITTELQANTAKPAFKNMLDNQHSVATQACQLWFKQDLQALGWTHGDDPISAAFTEPLDTYSDMSYLLSTERWQDGDEVRSIAYFCGPLPDAVPGQGMSDKDRARAFALALLDDLKPIFPNAFAGANFDRTRLATPLFYLGPDPFSVQYWRANSAGSERYVMTRKGTVKHRLRPHESGYPNLFLAGDWTRTGFDGGCVEAAVISGKAAANAIAGLPLPPVDDANPFPPVPPP